MSTFNKWEIVLNRFYLALHCRKRRTFFGDLAMIYRHGHPIPRVKVSLKIYQENGMYNFTVMIVFLILRSLNTPFRLKISQNCTYIEFCTNHICNDPFVKWVLFDVTPTKNKVNIWCIWYALHNHILRSHHFKEKING